MKSYARSSVELILPGIAWLTFCCAILRNYALSHNPIWLFSVIALTVYASFQLIIKGLSAEKQFLFLIPLTTGTIWHFFRVIGIDLSPLFYVAAAFAFFSLTFLNAMLAAGLLFLISVSGIVAGLNPGSFSFWFFVLSVVWGTLTWLHSYEKEQIETRFNNMKSRVKGLMNQTEESVTADHLPELDSTSMFEKAAANEFRLADLMSCITEIIQDVIHPHSCFFFCMDHEDKKIKIQAYKSKSRFFNDNAVIDINSPGILSWAVNHQREICHYHLPKGFQFPEYYMAKEKILACLVYPIMRDGRVEGLLGIDSKRSYSFSVDEDRTMKLFVRLSQDLLIAFRKYQSRDVHADYMAAFYQAVRKIIQVRLDSNTRIKTLIEICQMIKKCDEVAVAVPKEDNRLVLRDGQGDYMPRLIGAAIDENSVCGQLLQSGADDLLISPSDVTPERSNLFFAGETRFGLGSMMFIVLPIQINLKGILFLGARQRNFFSPNDRFLFTTLAEQFGIALENAINLEKKSREAITDGLTGAYNHRFFQETLQNEINLTRRDPGTFSLLLLDIDHFKKFNDTYGHQAGDEVLKHLVRLLKNYAREIDTVARYGGEEFVVILRKCDLKMAVKTAERIRKACDKQKLRIGEDVLNVTISIGVANFPLHAIESAALISVADQALYKAKEGGRNRVVFKPVETQ